MSFLDSVDADETLIDDVLTGGHPLRIVHIVSLPVAQLAIAARSV